jgi:hypothetical protein
MNIQTEKEIGINNSVEKLDCYELWASHFSTQFVDIFLGLLEQRRLFWLAKLFA